MTPPRPRRAVPALALALATAAAVLTGCSGDDEPTGSFADLWTDGLVPVLGDLAAETDFDVDTLNQGLAVPEGYRFAAPSAKDGTWCLEGAGRAATGTATEEKLAILLTDGGCGDVDDAEATVSLLYNEDTGVFDVVRGDDADLRKAIEENPGVGI